MTIPDNTIGYGAALPGLDSADFDDEDTGRRLRRKLSAGGPSVGALMRAGVACALQWPVAQVLIDSITNEKGVTTTYTTQSKVNLVDIGCDGQEIVARRLAEDTPLLMDLPVGSLSSLKVGQHVALRSVSRRLQETDGVKTSEIRCRCRGCWDAGQGQGCAAAGRRPPLAAALGTTPRPATSG